MKTLTLTGDENVPAMPLNESEVNHLRRLLAWMRLEYMLDEDMQRGIVRGVTEMVNGGMTTPERGSEILDERAKQINHVPIYLRQAIKKLTKTLNEHDKKSGVVET